MEAPHRVMHLSFSLEDQNGNDITCPSDPSPDSLRTNSSLSHGSTDSPADVEMVEDCISEGTSAENVVIKVRAQSDGVPYVNSVNDNCNQNSNVINSSLQNGNVDCSSSFPATRDLDAQRSKAETCLEPVEQKGFLVHSDNPSSCGSSDKSGSVSSGEMVVRSNSFLLHESDQLLSVSLLGESSDMLSDVGMTPGLLPDVCEGLGVNMVSASGKDLNHQGCGITFIQPCNQTFVMENEVFQTSAGLLVPQRGSGVGRASGIEKSECVTPVNNYKCNTEAQRLQYYKGGSTHSTPAEGKTIPTSEDLDVSGSVQTSTPVQSLNSKTFCLSSLSDSPKKSKVDSSSPIAYVMKKQQSKISQKPKTPLTAPIKSKSEIKKFAKPDFSNIKSKIISRPPTALKPSTVSLVKTTSNITRQVTKTPATKTSHSIQCKEPATSAVSSSTTVTPFYSSLKKDQSTVTKRMHSSAYQRKVPFPTSRPRTWSDITPSSKTAKEECDEKEVQVSKTNCLITEKSPSVEGGDNQTGPTKLGGTQASIKEERQVDGTLDIHRKPIQRKNSPKADSSRSADAVACDWSKGRLGLQPPSSRAGGVPAARTAAASLRPPPPSASKLKAGTPGKYGCATADMPSPRSKLSTSGDNSKTRLADGTGAEVSTGSHQRLSLTSKLPVKPRVHLKSSGASNGHTKPDNAEPSSGVFTRPPTNRASARTRLLSLPPRASSSGCKNTSSSQVSVRSATSILKTPASPRPARLSGAASVDKSKGRANARGQQQSQARGQPDLVPPETKPRGVEYYKALCEKKSQTIQQLKKHFQSNNRRFEAFAVVVQNLNAEHEDTVKRRRELSVELLNLREELVSSVQSCERLELEKEELRVAFDGVLQKVQEQHRSDLADLEERLKTFYSAEWEKVHQAYQDEADKCKTQMEQQLEELRAKHEVLKRELEVSHEEKVESLKQHYEGSFEELRKSHVQDMEALEKTLKDAEETLSNKIMELTTENTSLSERLKVEEDRRRELADKCQKDSHTLYLEQELESLKVVLDIKNKQIHQQDKKLMQMDKQMEKNVKLEDCLKKVQQENEDLKARMDRHAALSRQLSTEQAVLQESLQKETKVNKRLSMENEELLWKLQNGDLSSPRKVSPSSPSMTFQSPRNSGHFSSPPISPR